MAEYQLRGEMYRIHARFIAILAEVGVTSKCFRSNAFPSSIEEVWFTVIHWFAV